MEAERFVLPLQALVGRCLQVSTLKRANRDLSEAIDSFEDYGVHGPQGVVDSAAFRRGG